MLNILVLQGTCPSLCDCGKGGREREGVGKEEKSFPAVIGYWEADKHYNWGGVGIVINSFLKEEAVCTHLPGVTCSFDHRFSE